MKFGKFEINGDALIVGLIVSILPIGAIMYGLYSIFAVIYGDCPQ